MINHPTISKIKRKGLLWITGSRKMESIMVGQMWHQAEKAWRSELEAAWSHGIHTQEAQREQQVAPAWGPSVQTHELIGAGGV